MSWVSVKVTTVDYGDIYPIALLGKILRAIATLIRIRIFTLPTGIVGSDVIE